MFVQYLFAFTPTAKVEIFNETSGSLDESEVINYVLTIPSLGMTLQVCVLKGKIQLYGSVTLPNPNSALNIFTLNLNCSHTECQMNSVCQDIYVPYNQGPNTRSVQDETDRESVVHISVKGASAGKNSFILNTTEGSTHDGCAGNAVTIGCGGHSSGMCMHIIILHAYFIAMCGYLMCHYNLVEALYTIRTNFSFSFHRYCASYNNHLCVGSACILLSLCHGLCLCCLSTQEAETDDERG